MIHQLLRDTAFAAGLGLGLAALYFVVWEAIPKRLRLAEAPPASGRASQTGLLITWVAVLALAFGVVLHLFSGSDLHPQNGGLVILGFLILAALIAKHFGLKIKAPANVDSWEVRDRQFATVAGLIIGAILAFVAEQ